MLKISESLETKIFFAGQLWAFLSGNDSYGTFNGTYNGTFNGTFCGTFFSEPFHVIFDHKIGRNYWNTQMEEFGLLWNGYFPISEEVTSAISQTVSCV